MWFLYLESLQGYLLHPLKINYDQLYNAVLIVENFEFFFFIYFVEECITVFDGYYCLKKQTNKQDIDGQYSLSSFTG